MIKWQAGIYRPDDDERMTWITLNSKTMRSAMREADQWASKFTINTHPLSMICIAREGTERVSARRWLDETDWIRSKAEINIRVKT